VGVNGRDGKAVCGVGTMVTEEGCAVVEFDGSGRGICDCVGGGKGDMGDRVKEYELDGLLRVNTDNAREKMDALSVPCDVCSGAKTNCVICGGPCLKLLIFAWIERGEGGETITGGA